MSTERDEDWLVLDVAATDAWHLTLQSSDPADPAAAPDGAGEEFWPDVTGSLRLDLAGDSAEAGEVALVLEIGASSSVISLVRGDRIRACLGHRLISGRWGVAAGYYLAISLWRG